MANVNYIDVVNYFATVAQEHVSLQDNPSGERHFARINLDELMGNLRTNLKFPCLVIESPDAALMDEHIDNEQKVYNVAFVVMDKVPQGDFDAQDDALDSMEQIVMDIIARVRKEHRDYSASGISKGFQESTVRWNKFGPKWENCFGWRCTFQVMNHIDLHYDAGRWG